MTDLTLQLCSIRLEQKDSINLLPPVDYQTWISRAKDRLNQMRRNPPAPDSDEFHEADCLKSNLEDIAEYRARIIWDDAYTGRGDIAAMTPKEREAYLQLCSIAATIRGGAE